MKLITPPIKLARKVICFSTTICGGVSSGAFDSLNLAYHVDDSSPDVRHNRQIVNDYISEIATGARPAIFMNQQHTSNICDVDLSEFDERQAFDGLCSSDALLPLAVMTADCLPVVMSDGKKIAAVHAGWKGLIDNILREAVVKFDMASPISAWIGPSISRSNFEVGEDVAELFKAHSKHIYPDAVKNKYFVDLKAVCREQLMALGVTNVELANECTYSDQRFFSHRRAMHTGLKNTGRNATFILKTV